MSILSVSDVTRYIKQLFDRDPKLPSLFIRGEISNFKRHYSGHCYFTLKDSQATIKAVMFKSRAQYMKFEPKDGLKVIAGGQITVFERDGQYQLYVEQLVPEGVGELSLAYAQLKEKLEAEGLFDEARKLSLPILPKTVGLVTSPTGAALRDMISVSKRRHPHISLVLYPVLVQGPEAPLQIVQAIQVFNRLAQVDVIIVGRGGGSIEELWAFNDERVVRAIAASVIPVVSAVGHQTDYTLADFVADRRAATPSQAAEIVVPDIKELQRYVVSMRNILETNIRNNVKNLRLQLEQCRDSRVFTYPPDLLNDKRQLLDGYVQHIEQAIRQTLLTKQHQFEITAEKMAMLNPLAVLARGYSIVRTSDSKVVKQASDVAPGQELEVILHEGMIQVTVVPSKGGD
ncbi:MAG TPA: exodeoxyribonuclease VII large subunit [Negativicutes bacterium]